MSLAFVQTRLLSIFTLRRCSRITYPEQLSRHFLSTVNVMPKRKRTEQVPVEPKAVAEPITPPRRSTRSPKKKVAAVVDDKWDPYGGEAVVSPDPEAEGSPLTDLESSSPKNGKKKSKKKAKGEWDSDCEDESDAPTYPAGIMKVGLLPIFCLY